MSLNKAAWREIARLWLEGVEPLKKIAERYGISYQKITVRARLEGWPPRATKHAPKSPTAAGCPQRQNRHAPAASTRPTAEGLGAGCSAPADRGSANHGTAGGQRSTAPAKPVRKKRGAARRAMAERLFEAMDMKLSAIEARMATGGDQSAVDSERTTRTLNTLVRSLEKLTDYECKITSRSGRKNGKRRQAGADAERRRQEIAARIQRLLQDR